MHRSHDSNKDNNKYASIIRCSPVWTIIYILQQQVWHHINTIHDHTAINNNTYFITSFSRKNQLKT